jgi:hypothetical protein
VYLPVEIPLVALLRLVYGRRSYLHLYSAQHGPGHRSPHVRGTPMLRSPGQGFHHGRLLATRGRNCVPCHFCAPGCPHVWLGPLAIYFTSYLNTAILLVWQELQDKCVSHTLNSGLRRGLKEFVARSLDWLASAVAILMSTAAVSGGGTVWLVIVVSDQVLYLVVLRTYPCKYHGGEHISTLYVHHMVCKNERKAYRLLRKAEGKKCFIFCCSAMDTPPSDCSRTGHRRTSY